MEPTPIAEFFRFVAVIGILVAWGMILWNVTCWFHEKGEDEDEE